MKLKRSKLVVYNAEVKNIDGIVALSADVYGKTNAYTDDVLRGQINNFPEGQFIAVFNGKIVGYCATFIVDEKEVLKKHNWKEITGNGFATRHNPNGNVLYGMEVFVDEKYRGLRIGQRLYDARKNLCRELGLKGIIFGGRMPNYYRRSRKYPTPQAYIEAILNKEVNDLVVNFHLRNGFELIGVLEDYLPFDKQSKGHATHMYWKNPLYREESKTRKQRGRLPNTVRVANVQFQARKVNDETHFEKQIEYFVDIASDYKADFVCFPEYVTLSLLSMENKQGLSPAESMKEIAKYEKRYIDFMQKLAISYNINIIGGTLPTLSKEHDIHNTAFVFLRDGATYRQDKLQTTPNERYWWNMKGGDHLDVIQTDSVPIGVLICYDSEFPELSRHLADQGALILFVPFCTDERQGYLRVRYCCQARAVENQFYVVASGVVGNIPDVENMDIHYAQSMIITPCDFPFARDGIAAEASANTETIIFADLKMDSLYLSRNDGTVTNLKDRRYDLYRQEWVGK